MALLLFVAFPWPGEAPVRFHPHVFPTIPFAGDAIGPLQKLALLLCTCVTTFRKSQITSVLVHIDLRAGGPVDTNLHHLVPPGHPISNRVRSAQCHNIPHPMTCARKSSSTQTPIGLLRCRPYSKMVSSPFVP